MKFTTFCSYLAALSPAIRIVASLLGVIIPPELDLLVAGLCPAGTVALHVKESPVHK